MKTEIQTLLVESLKKLIDSGEICCETVPQPQVTNTRAKDHGDYASNIALVLAKTLKISPQDLAQKLIATLPASKKIQRVEVAGPGFINFYITDLSLQNVVVDILDKGEKFGTNNLGNQKRVHIEFVSANPTGPLHVGHGRGAAIGATAANLLDACGYQVHREYYVNDAGRQMNLLAISVWLRYLQLYDKRFKLPPKAYEGNYVIDIAENLKKIHGSMFQRHFDELQTALSHENNTDDADKLLDAYVRVTRKLLGHDNYKLIFSAGMETILADIKDDLAEFGVNYQDWFRESLLTEKKLIQTGIELLTEKNYVYEKEGAIWFRATAVGDDKDRVLIRSNGDTTYFASDVAYHLYKYQQKYDIIIDVFGSDHHGYIPRIKAFLNALGQDVTTLKTLLVQFAILYRGKEKISMSTRGGKFVTLRELRKEVGNDAARFFYVMRKPEQHLDFDLDLAKSQSNENPVYYIQYAHARICSIWRELKKQQQTFDRTLGLQQLNLLSTAHEKDLLILLNQYSEVIKKAGIQLQPHLLAHYLQDLAAKFHGYYNQSKILIDDASLRDARLCLISATQQILYNGLALLGVSSPEIM